MSEQKVTMCMDGVENSETKFDITHAQKILNSRNNKLIKGQSWVLADKNFDLKDGRIVRRKPNKKDSGGPEA